MKLYDWDGWTVDKRESILRLSGVCEDTSQTLSSLTWQVLLRVHPMVAKKVLRQLAGDEKW